MATIPGIMIDIGANVAKMQADMRRLTGTMESGFGRIRGMAMNLAGIVAGAFSFRQMILFGQEALKAGDQLAKMSQSAGVSVETLAGLKYAAELADVDLETLAKGMGILSRNMLDAQAGTGEAKDAIKALGLIITDTSGNLLASDKVLGQVADRFAAMEDGSTKTALAMRIFGRSGAALIPLLNQGSASIFEMRAEAEQLGLVISRETAQKMELVNDNFTRMKSAAQGVALQIMSNILPTLENLTNMLVHAAKSEKDLAGASEAAATALKLLASSGLVVLTAFRDIGGGIGAIAAAIATAAQGDFRTAWQILNMEGEDSRKIWAETGKILDKIWSKSAEDAVRAGDKIKKSFTTAPALAGQDEKQIENRIRALFEEAEALQMGADALLLFRKGFHNASQETREYALYLMNLIEAHEQEKKALLDRVKAEEEDEKQIRESEKALFDMVDALKIQAITAGMSEEETFKFQLTLQGASQTLVENSEAYFKAIRAARQYQEEIDLVKGVIEETKSPMDRYMERMEEIQRLLDQGMIGPEKALQAERIAWDRMIGGEKDTVAERELILLDFADRVRAQNLFTADYAIAQIERQAAIFKSAGADEVAVAFWAAKEKQKASREWEDGAVRALENYAAEATNAARNVEQAIGSGLRTMEDALVDFVKTGKLNFRDLIDSIIRDLARLVIRGAITGPLAGALSSVLAGLFSGGGGGAGTAAFASEGLIAHAGGIVGSTSFPARSMPAAYLAAAPRYHAGLQPGEYPAVLKRGEGVFTPEQMKALGNRTEISIPISITAGAMDARRAGQLRRSLEEEIEPAVRRVLERYS